MLEYNHVYEVHDWINLCGTWTVVRPAVGLETVPLRKRQEAELEVAEVKMLRFTLGGTRMDRIRNENIRRTVLERKTERPD